MSRTIYEEICKDTLRKNLTAGLNRRDDMSLSTTPTIASVTAPVTITTTSTMTSKATATTPPTKTPTAILSSATAQASALKSPIVNKTSSSVVPLFDYYLFEEKKRRVEECHDGADRHKGCYFIFRGDDKVDYTIDRTPSIKYTLSASYYHSIPQKINQSLTCIHNINRPSHTHIPSPDHEGTLF